MTGIHPFYFSKSLQTQPVPTWVRNVTISKNANEDNKKSLNYTEVVDKKTIERLKLRDREVRQHEMAHKSAGGQFAGVPTYTYRRGPDGRLYAVGGEVKISVSKVPGNPEATERKADQIKRAALAPANPSSADLQIASRATLMKLKAQMESKSQKVEEQNIENEEKQDNTGNRLSKYERAKDAYLGFGGFSYNKHLFNFLV